VAIQKNQSNVIIIYHCIKNNNASNTVHTRPHETVPFELALERDEQDEDQVYELLQTSASLLDQAASHNHSMMHHSYGGSMDMQFALDDDSDDEDEEDHSNGDDKSTKGSDVTDQGKP